ncbi:hypothetical protein R1sor_022029 [Riccia sorocarpa]|uniref:Reverse transcriptase zinc-binding domain-containing protein n=1 Tax=Riccia sorocarpa TaxID=122646 RepID=A0ABD3GJE0_9MARC
MVLKHALAVMPNYYLMTLGLTANGYAKLDRICWKFLWGKTREGQDRKPLISWDRICCTKEEGGLGLTSFQDQSLVLKMRLVTRILEGDTADWAEVARIMLEEDFTKKRVNTGKIRSAGEILLLEPVNSKTLPRTLGHMLKGWHKGRKKLTLNSSRQPRSAGTPIEIVTRIRELYSTGPKGSWTQIRRRLRTMGVERLCDLQGRTLERLRAADRAGTLPDAPHRIEGPNSIGIHFMEQWAEESSEHGAVITDRSIWSWPGENRERELTWSLNIKEWKTILIPPYNIRQKGNASWGVSWDTQKWTSMWKGVWQTSLFPRDKIWWWRILNKGLFTMERAYSMVVAEASCKVCGRATENTDHLFLRCDILTATWRSLKTLYYTTTGKELRDTSLPQLTIDLAVPTNLAAAILFVVYSRFTWKSRCKATYEGHYSITYVSNMGPRATGHEAAELIAALEEGELQSTDREDAREGHRPRERTRQQAAGSAADIVVNSPNDEELSTWVDARTELAVLGFTERDLEEGIG